MPQNAASDPGSGFTLLAYRKFFASYGKSKHIYQSSPKLQMDSSNGEDEQDHWSIEVSNCLTTFTEHFSVQPPSNSFHIIILIYR